MSKDTSLPKKKAKQPGFLINEVYRKYIYLFMCFNHAGFSVMGFFHAGFVLADNSTRDSPHLELVLGRHQW